MPDALQVGQWFCLEFMMHANTSGEHDGYQEYSIDGTLDHRVDNMM